MLSILNVKTSAETMYGSHRCTFSRYMTTLLLTTSGTGVTNVTNSLIDARGETPHVLFQTLFTTRWATVDGICCCLWFSLHCYDHRCKQYDVELSYQAAHTAGKYGRKHAGQHGVHSHNKGDT